jgi:hypothetical protein
MSHPYVQETIRKAITPVYPTVRDVLEWTRAYNGVVMPEWTRSPTRCKLARIVFAESRESRRASGTCSIVRSAINQFYPNVPVNSAKKHSCIVNVQQDDRIFQVLILESNVPALVKDELSSEMMKLDYPPYGKCLRGSKPTTFLEVTGVNVYQP